MHSVNEWTEYNISWKFRFLSGGALRRLQHYWKLASASTEKLTLLFFRLSLLQLCVEEIDLCFTMEWVGFWCVVSQDVCSAFAEVLSGGEEYERFFLHCSDEPGSVISSSPASIGLASCIRFKLWYITANDLSICFWYLVLVLTFSVGIADKGTESYGSQSRYAKELLAIDVSDRVFSWTFHHLLMADKYYSQTH